MNQIDAYLHRHQLNRACDAFLDIASPNQEEAFWKLYTAGQDIIQDITIKANRYKLTSIDRDCLDADSFYMINGYGTKEVSLVSQKQLAKDIHKILNN